MRRSRSFRYATTATKWLKDRGFTIPGPYSGWRRGDLHAIVSFNNAKRLPWVVSIFK